MSLRRRLEQQQLPARTVTLAPVVQGADPDDYEVRALDGDLWDGLVRAHPPTEAQRVEGWGWDSATFRPALLAACVVTPDGEEPLTEKEWADLLPRMPAGQRDRLYMAALDVNDHGWPDVDLGKG